MDITPRQHAKIKRAVASLNQVREEIQDDNPGCYVNWYLEDNDNLNLMSGDSHDGIEFKPRRDRVIGWYQFDCASGGGW